MVHAAISPSTRQSRAPLHLLSSPKTMPADDDYETVRFVKVPSEVVFNTALSPWARLVVCALESHKGERGIFPRQEVLAAELGTSTDTIGRAIKELRAHGIVEVDRQGRGHANRYSLSYETAPMRNQTADDTASMRSHNPDETAPVQDQNTIDTASLRELETAPMRNPETAPVRHPIRTRSKRTRSKRTKGVNPQTPTAEKTASKTKAKPESDDYPPEMVTFWNACTKKARQRSSKDEVATEWRKIDPDAATAERILTSVRAWNQTDDFVRGFAQGAHRFLKSGKWKELPETDDGGAPSTNGHHDSPASRTMANFDRVLAQLYPEDDETESDVFETNGVVR